MKNALIWAGVLVGGYYLFSRARAMAILNFVVKGVGFGGGGIQVTIGVQNPSSTTLTLSSIVGNIVAPDGTPLGNFTSFYSQAIQANAETPILVTITGNVVGIISEALNAIQSGAGLAGHYLLKGYANINGQAFPLEIALT